MLLTNLAVALAACAAAAAGPEEPSKETAVKDLAESLLEPFWKSGTMRGEGLFFCERKAGEPASATLLFPPGKILAVKSASGKISYEEGKDYAVDKATGVVRLLPGSRIPMKTLAEMYPPADSKLPKYAHKRGDPKTHLIFGEGHFFHDLQVEVTYTHAPGLWKGYAPAFADDKLPRTLKKLKDKQPLKISLVGDSISAGANASKCSKVDPQMPPYGELVALGLEKAYGTKVEFKNFAVGGWCTEQGLGVAERIGAEKPDLVIVAFGMNDSGNKDAAKYAANTKAIMDKVRAGAPEAEFILVSSMLPNAEWHYPKMENFPLFRDELAKLAGPGVALADLTAVWTEILKRKAWHDLTGNGVNHPNDFGHRLYAQTILGLLVEPATEKPSGS
jgi:lysophospholipase L1-like esterase